MFVQPMPVVSPALTRHSTFSMLAHLQGILRHGIQNGAIEVRTCHYSVFVANCHSAFRLKINICWLLILAIAVSLT